MLDNGVIKGSVKYEFLFTPAPTLTRSYTKRAFLQARARRGSGRGLALPGATVRPTLLQRLARDEDEEEAESLADLHL